MLSLCDALSGPAVRAQAIHIDAVRNDMHVHGNVN